MKTLSPLMLAAAAALIFASPVLAQTPATAPAATPATKAAPEKSPASKSRPERTAASVECSKQADAKNLHGKDRRKFRADCKKTAGKPN